MTKGFLKLRYAAVCLVVVASKVHGSMVSIIYSLCTGQQKMSGPRRSISPMQAPFFMQRAKEELVIISGTMGWKCRLWGAKMSLLANAQWSCFRKVGDLNHGSGGPCLRKHPDPSSDV